MFPQHQGLVQLCPSQHHHQCHMQRLENYLDLMDQILDKAEMQDVKKHSETEEAETEVEVAIDTTSDEDNTEVDATKEKKFKKTIMTQVKVEENDHKMEITISFID